jgi:ketosteroid isomerase-like protein
VLKRTQKKRIFAVVVLVVVATSLALGQMADQQEKTKGGKASVQQILIQMERDGNEATVKKDGATLDKLIADDWVYQGSDGTQTKAQALADLKSEDQKFDSITLGDMKVRVFGNTPIVSGSEDEKSTYKGKDTSGHYSWTDVFVKRHGHWQLVASQATPIAKQ